jgi:hypothetical protein
MRVKREVSHRLDFHFPFPLIKIKTVTERDPDALCAASIDRRGPHGRW